MSDAQDNPSRWANVGMLASLALMLSYAETFVPIPLPGVKLGLANIAVLVALSRGDLRGAVCVAIIKVLAVGLLFGSPLTMLYSLVGTGLSLAGTMPLSRLRTMRLWMLSVVGAVLHVLGQLAVAAMVMATNIVWHASPVLIAASCGTGVLCGMLAQRLAACIPEDAGVPGGIRLGAPRLARRPPARMLVAFAGLLTYVVTMMRLEDPAMLGAGVALSAAACVTARLSPRSLARMGLSLAGIAVCTLVLHSLFAPQDALRQTVSATARLAGIAAMSMAFMRIVPKDDLVGTVAWLVMPFERMGFDTSGFVLSFDVAIRLLPTVSRIVREDIESHKPHVSLRMMWDLLPRLILRLYEEPDVWE